MTTEPVYATSERGVLIKIERFADVAFRRGIPLLTVNQHGDTHIVRNQTEYDAAHQGPRT